LIWRGRGGMIDRRLRNGSPKKIEITKACLLSNRQRLQEIRKRKTNKEKGTWEVGNGKDSEAKFSRPLAVKNRRGRLIISTTRRRRKIPPQSPMSRKNVSAQGED